MSLKLSSSFGSLGVVTPTIACEQVSRRAQTGREREKGSLSPPFRLRAPGSLFAAYVTPFMVGQEDKRTNNRTMFPALKNSAAAGYKSLVKIKLLKGAGLLIPSRVVSFFFSFSFFLFLSSLTSLPM